MAEKKDLYEILGVSKTATQDEIKSAYRAAAKKWHPDKFFNASEAEKKEADEKIKEINYAYSVLSDEKKRANYDQYGSEDGPQGGFDGFSGGFSGGFGGFEDIFNIFTGGGFSGRNRANMAQDGDDVNVSMTLEFKEAAFGCEKDVNFVRVEVCSDCKGTGAKDGTAFKTCTKRNGKGIFEQVVNSMFGQTRRTTSCDKCRGTGKEVVTPCPTCAGKGYLRKNRTHHVKVPAGVDNGQRLSYRGEGHSGRNGGESGNLIINISVKNHELFKRKGYDLYLDYPITAVQAAMGCTIKVPTLEDSVSFDIPAGTQYGTSFTLRKKGIKVLFKEQKGDLHLNIIVEIPVGLTKKQAKQLSDFDSSLSADQYPKCRKFKKSIT